ncbi:indoleacetamide hydrolase [Oricola sp.]|uniref:indoleacetamide hydrolase n=1 Tax=Oricola sp. TaxID=1979950 RepID=UPI0025F18079|nr:indoleacetamide hydrolase [Oricola sp.]MCI5077164.1 indoleacetamide hydrolase [Oricola sp.]
MIKRRPGLGSIFGSVLALTLTTQAGFSADATDMAMKAKAGETSAADAVEAALARAAEKEALNAFITIDAEGARKAAAEADAAQTHGPLYGVVIAVKDNIASAGLATSAGTPALKDWAPGKDATVLERLRAAGAILVGKTNMHELAFGITSNNAGFGAVHNAWDETKFAGGSSGGTAAAVAAGIVPAGLGTDTGGSVRLPSALNGIAGLRPTVGRYPQDGIVPISHTRDTAGPMARSVRDLALLDGVITGASDALETVDLSQMRFGLPAAFVSGLDPETKAVFDDAVATLQDAGATFVEMELPGLIDLNDKVGFPLALYEVKRDLARFLEENDTGITIEDVAAGVASPDVKFVFDNLVLGDQAIPAAVYDAAMRDFRPAMQALYAEAFARLDLDALAFPTTKLPARPIEGSDMEVELNGAKVPTFNTFIANTDPGSNAGLPGLSLPAGVTASGLPVGLELDGPMFTDRRLLAIGQAVEAVLGFEGLAD